MSLYFGTGWYPFGLLATVGLVIAFIAKIMLWLTTPHCVRCGASMQWHIYEHTDVCAKCHNREAWEEIMSEMNDDYPALRCTKCGVYIYDGFEEAEEMCYECFQKDMWTEIQIQESVDQAKWGEP